MEISIHSLLEGTARATGTVALIDVFRAFTSTAVALANGATGIVMVGTVKEAVALREASIGEICMGEVRGRALDGFDFGNSPFEISGVDFSGKTIIQRTSAGTQGIVAAGNRATRLYAASLVTAEATVRALLSGALVQTARCDRLRWHAERAEVGNGQTEDCRRPVQGSPLRPRRRHPVRALVSSLLS